MLLIRAFSYIICYDLGPCKLVRGKYVIDEIFEFTLQKEHGLFRFREDLGLGADIVCKM